jgi:hypothetical protein
MIRWVARLDRLGGYRSCRRVTAALSPPANIATSDSKPVDPRATGHLKHGLTGARLYFATPEDAEAFKQLQTALLEELAPGTAMETDLAHQLICDRWRLISAAELESKIYHLACQSNQQENPHISQAKTWLQDSTQIARITLYETRIQSRYDKNLAEYRRMWKERIRTRTAMLEAAKAEAARIAEMGGDLETICKPIARYGFDISPDEVQYFLPRPNPPQAPSSYPQRPDLASLLRELEAEDREERLNNAA